MATRIELEPFDIEDKERCAAVIASLLPLIQSYYEINKAPDDPPFNFNFVEFVKDWWQGEKVLLMGYEDDQLVGFLYAKVGGNLFTSEPELRVKFMYVLDTHADVVDKLRDYAKQLLPLYKCVRFRG